MSKTVLILSTSFVPDRNGRAARLRARSKYLVADHHWNVVVQLASEEPVRQEELLNGSSCVVYRMPPANEMSSTESDGFERVIESMKSVIRPLLFPDLHVASLPTAYRNARHIIRAEEVEVLYTMCYPFSFHLLGYLIQKTTDVSWVAEFRDPWVTNPNHFGGEAGLAHKRLERLVVENADQVVYNYGIQLPDQYFARTYPASIRKVTQLDCPGSCGFDFDRLDDVSPPVDKFRIVYGGTFYGNGHSPLPFLEGVEIFLDRTDLDPRSIQIDFYGDWNDEFTAAVDQRGLCDIVTAHGWITPDKFLHELQRSHASLFIVRPFSGDELNVPQKVVEYIGAEAPMLVLADKRWEAASFTEQNGVGVVAEPDDVVDIADAIKRLYDAYERDSLDEYKASEDVRTMIDARTQTDMFSTVLDRALENAGG